MKKLISISGGYKWSLCQLGGNVKLSMGTKKKTSEGHVRTCALGDIPKDSEVTHYFYILAISSGLLNQ